MEFGIEDLFEHALGGFTGMSVDIQTVMYGMITICLILFGFRVIVAVLQHRNGYTEEEREQNQAWQDSKIYHEKMNQFKKGTIAHDYYKQQYRNNIRKM